MFKKTKLSSTSKKFKKNEKRFYFVDQSKIWIYIQKIFLTFTHWWFSNVRLMNLQIFFLFWKISQSILLQVLHPLESFPLSTFKQKIFRTNKFKIKALQNPFYLSINKTRKKNWKTPQKDKYALDKMTCHSLKIYIFLTNCVWCITCFNFKL